MWRSAFKRKGADPSEPRATPPGRTHSPSKQVPVQVPVEVIPKTLWMDQELQQLRRDGQWPYMTAQLAERLLDVGAGEVTELMNLQEAFDLVDELGCGECAVVYRAVHKQDGAEMALKVLQFGGGVNEGAEATSLAMARNELTSLSMSLKASPW